MILKGQKYIKENTATFLIILIAITIPFKTNVCNLAIIIAVIYSVIKVYKAEINLKTLNNYAFWLPFVLFLCSLISSLLSNNINSGLRYIDKSLLLLLIPPVIILLSNKGINVKSILLSYITSISFSTFILLMNSGMKIIDNVSLEDVIFHNFTALYDQHPVYYAMFIVLAIFFLLDYIDKNWYFSSIWIKFFLSTSLLILLIGLILCASKGVIIIFCFLTFTYAIRRFASLRKRLLLVLAIISFLGVMYTIPEIKERFLNGLVFDMKNFSASDDIANAKLFSYEEKTKISDLELRLIFAKISMYHATKNVKIFLFGYGTGDVQDNLDYQYMIHNLAPNWYEGFNVHNQYINIFLSMGIFVLVLFLSYLMYSYSKAFDSNQILYLNFLVLITIVFTFEVILIRNKGIVFFYFFNTLFLINNLRFENSNNRN